MNRTYSWIAFVTTLFSLTALASATGAHSQAGGYASVVLADSPVAYWRLGESSGTTAVDASGNGLHGTYFNGVGLGAAGGISGDSNTAASLDGSDDRIDRPPVTTQLTNVTLEAWIYWAGCCNGSGGPIVLYNGNSGSSGFGLQISSGGGFACGPANQLFVLLGGVTCDAAGPGGAIPLNQWTHVAATRTSGNVWAVYVNAVKRTERAGSPGPGQIVSGGTTVGDQFGGGGGDGAFQGRVDEVAVYNTALTPARIQAHYEAGAPPPPTITTTSLPGGTANQTYSQSVTATAGTSPYSWLISAGALPPGLSLSPSGTPSATISGTPTTAGTYDFTIRVTDGASRTDTQDLSIVVAGATPPPVDPAPLDDFNRPNENPVAQGGNWSSVGLNGGAGAPLSSSRLRNFPAASGGYSYRVRPYLGGSMEASVTIQTRPTSSNHSLSVFVCLQDVGTAGWDGYELKAINVNGSADRWEIWRIDNGVSNPPTPLASTNFEMVAGGKMLLRNWQGLLQFWWKPPSGAWQLKIGNPLLIDLTYQWGMIGAGGVQTGALDDFGGGSLSTLLEQYAPELRHSAFDTYRASSPAMLTDNISDAGLTNVLISDSLILAAADWSLEADNLSLSYLSSAYPPGGLANGRQATSSDYLDGVDDSRTADAQRLQANPAYSDVVYGRVKSESGGRTTIQYWLFYYFNWHPAFTSAGDHEGDWEMVQFELDARGVPTRASYSQHGDGEVCPWSFTQRNAEGKAVVYPARGTHASYFRPGTKPGQIPIAPDDDEADGNAAPLTPAASDLQVPTPSWLNWPGRWGDKAGTFPSPVGPMNQGTKWSSPADWADAQEGCWEMFSYGGAVTQNAALAARPPAPTIVARRVEKRVRISYSFPRWPSGPARPVSLLTSVQSRELRFAPFMKRHRIAARTGVVWQPLGLGKGPFKLYAASYSREGRSSTTVTVRVRGS